MTDIDPFALEVIEEVNKELIKDREDDQKTGATWEHQDLAQVFMQHICNLVHGLFQKRLFGEQPQTNTGKPAKNEHGECGKSSSHPVMATSSKIDLKAFSLE